MTVRWKPLLILSGLFLVIAMVGLLVMALDLGASGPEKHLDKARQNRKAKAFDVATIHYRNALQHNPSDAAVHEELASMYAEQAEGSEGEKAEQARALRFGALVDAARHGRKLAGPRKELLAEAMRLDDPSESARWAKELLTLEPDNAEAHFALACEGLEEIPADLPEVRKHLAAIDKPATSPVRLAYLKARLARASGDDAALEAALASVRTLELAPGSDAVDRMALLRVRALDVQATLDPESLAARVASFESQAKSIADDPSAGPARISRLARELEAVLKSLVQAADFQPDVAAKAAVNRLGEAVETVAEATYTRSIESGTADLTLYLTYADHLRFRGKRARCLEVVEAALKSPQAEKGGGGNAEKVLALRAVAVEASLADTDDPGRFEAVEPHIKELIGSGVAVYQGLGHLFQGAIELEKSGVAGASNDATGPAGEAPTPKASADSSGQAKLRASALNHLKTAAELLPRLAEAQARYGVALILSQEQALGRQFLAKASSLGELDPQYQVWAAWSMVQAGYPEEAEPIVDRLLADVEAGRKSREMAGTLHLLRGEIHQARRSPEDLSKALTEYEKAFEAGQEPTPAVQLRLAQIDVMRGRPAEALKRIDAQKAMGKGSAPAEQLAVLTLQEQGKADEARKRLDEARKAYPRSTELIGLDAALLVKAGQAAEADRVLDEFLAAEPDQIALVQMRAQVLADHLDNPAEARRLLGEVAERSENSAPLVQLADMEIKRRDYDAAAEAIARIRRRWKEAAAADLLDAQLAIARNQLAVAAGHFDAALKKDPTNKVVQYWKAQLDSRIGATAEAARALEEIARDKPTKELDTGLSLLTAAESALAGLELANGQYDSAIARFNQLIQGGEAGEAGRTLRWQLVQALSAKGQWDQARREVQAILADVKAPPRPEDRVRAAQFFRLQKDLPAAVAQLDAVLKDDPAQPTAAVTRAALMHDAGQTAQAAALIRRAIADSKTPPAPFFLMLAALENLLPPAEDGLTRALAVLDQGLEAQSDSIELVQAKYRAMRLAGKDGEAVAFVEGRAKAEPKGPFRRLLVDLHRERGDLAAAESALKSLLEDAPDDNRLAATLVRVVSDRAIAAAEAGDRERERALNDQTALLIRDFRAKFPQDTAFLRADWELAFRKGELARAATIAQEADALSKTSPLGPLLRARLYASQGRTREMADAYAEALGRNPRQVDLKVELGRAKLELGEVDEAVRQASAALEIERDRPDALLLKARALSAAGGPPSQVAAGREQAVALLTKAIADNPESPRLADFYHQLAEVYALQGQRAKAVDALVKGLDAAPGDAGGLSQLVEMLCSPTGPGQATAPADVEKAQALAHKYAAQDREGYMSLAAAVGFHKGRQLSLALPWAEQAASRLDKPVVHLNHGDLLLSIAESTRDTQEASGYFRRAVEQYDRVLKANANSVEAINNKAWILHTYLNASEEALELANGLLRRVDPTTLPGEFFDTLGAIQEELGRPEDAEASYAKGLRKAPDHPMLNYHMGRLLAADRKRSAKAGPYLEKAEAGRDELPPPMAEEVAALIRKVGK